MTKPRYLTVSQDRVIRVLKESNDWRLWPNVTSEIRLRSGRTVRPNDMTRCSLVVSGLIEENGDFVRITEAGLATPTRPTPGATE